MKEILFTQHKYCCLNNVLAPKSPCITNEMCPQELTEYEYRKTRRDCLQRIFRGTREREGERDIDRERERKRAFCILVIVAQLVAQPHVRP